MTANDELTPTVASSISSHRNFILSRRSIDQYDDWVYLMESLLIRHNEWDETTKSPKDTPLAHALIVDHINIDIVALIKHTKKASVIWKLLASKFFSKTVPGQVSAIKELCSFSFKDD